VRAKKGGTDVYIAKVLLYRREKKGREVIAGN
jgi:hypothetical protein